MGRASRTQGCAARLWGDMGNSDKSEDIIPVVEEEARLRKRVVETGKVRVHSTVLEEEKILRETLSSEDVEIERVPINEPVETVPQIRSEGDMTVIPVLEEVLVVERRLILREEVRLRRVRRDESVEKPVTVRRTDVSIERE